MSRQKFTLKIDSTMDGQRVDLAVISHSDFEMSRRKLRRILDVGGVYINRKRVRVASRQVFNGDVVEIEYNSALLAPTFQQQFELKDMPKIYEDDYVIAFNKPAGLPSQATRDQSVMHAEKLAKTYVDEHAKKKFRPILLHRLDKETTGVLLFAKNGETAEFITDQFRQKTIEKSYLALVYGQPNQYEFKVKINLSPIENKTGLVKKVRSGGKKSETEFTLIGTNIEHNISLMKCMPKTGRSHQIRVHLEHKGHPIVGDKKYGRVIQHKLAKALEAIVQQHHMLHAEELVFKPYPKADHVVVRAQLPKTFKKLASSLSL